MPKTNKSTVFKNNRGQYQITIPRAIGEGMQLEDESVRFVITSSRSLKMFKVRSKEIDQYSTVKVFKNNNNQFQVTIPRAIAEGMKLEGKKVELDQFTSDQSIRLSVL